MMTLLALALAVTAVDPDPVPGFAMYVPKLGEEAVLHNYNPTTGVVNPQVMAWTNTTALHLYLEALFGPEATRERDRVAGDPKAQEEVLQRQLDRYQKEPAGRGQIAALADMTPVHVRVLAQFRPTQFDGGVIRIVSPDFALVEVNDGPSRGRFFWVSRFFVRVPGAKAPEPFKFTLDGDSTAFDDDDSHPALEPDPVPDAAPARPVKPVKPARPQRPAPPLRVEDTSWTRSSSGNYVQVSVRARNVTGRPMEDVRAEVIYQDAAGKMVSTSTIIFGDLRPGELKTVSSYDPVKPMMHHYNLEFSSREDGERHSVEFSHR